MLSAEESRERILRRAKAELSHGDVVNLGVGLPTALTEWISPADRVVIHSENGILGVGTFPGHEDDVDPALVNASKHPVTVEPGASFFDSAMSFAMIRGGHVDVAIIGALQVDQRGQLANWLVPGQNVLGVGGAMDLVSGVKSVVVVTTHCTKYGDPKIVEECDYPLTADRPVDTVITERAVFRRAHQGLVLTEVGEGFEVDDILSCTSAKFEIAEELGTFN
jgi:3-oxoacid CoA-transferase B subunit